MGLFLSTSEGIFLSLVFILLSPESYVNPNIERVNLYLLGKFLTHFLFWPWLLCELSDENHEENQFKSWKPCCFFKEGIICGSSFTHSLFDRMKILSGLFGHETLN